MQDENSSNEKRKWRKKRKTVLSNAKKYQKKGQFGRGSKMSDDNYQYFMNILEVMQKGFSSHDERQILVNNVLERTIGEELDICCNQLGCRIVELLLPFAQPSDLERFMTALSPDLRKLCSDNFSSHVVEKLLSVACDRAVSRLRNADVKPETPTEPPEKRRKADEPEIDADVSHSENHVEVCHNFTLKVCRYALNNLEEFIWDPYANHILRMAIKCAGGVESMPERNSKKTFKTNLCLVSRDDELQKVKNDSQLNCNELKYRDMPEVFKTLVKEYANRLLQWPQFNDLPYQSLTSGLLQVLLYAASNTDKKIVKAILKKLLNESFAPDSDVISRTDEKMDGAHVTNGGMVPVFKCEPSLRLLEVALAVARSKLYTQIYAKCFINRLSILSTMQGVNFTVQRLFDNCDIKEELESMFDEISDKFNGILFSGNTGVLVAVAKACLRLKSRQAQFIASLETGLNCSEVERQKHFAVLCARLMPLDRVNVADHAKDYFVNVHGSVIVQTVLEFNRPTKMVNSLLEMTAEELLVLFKDAKGCRIADTFSEGQFVGVKARDKMIWKMKGFYPELALSKYGSRAMEAIFKAALYEQKCKIMDELGAKGQLMLGTPFGRLIHTKLNVELYKKSKDQWKAQMRKIGMSCDDSADKSRDKKKKKFKGNK